jgi:hypothetical protein
MNTVWEYERYHIEIKVEHNHTMLYPLMDNANVSNNRYLANTMIFLMMIKWM